MSWASEMGGSHGGKKGGGMGTSEGWGVEALNKRSSVNILRRIRCLV